MLLSARDQSEESQSNGRSHDGADRRSSAPSSMLSVVDVALVEELSMKVNDPAQEMEGNETLMRRE